MSITGFEDEGDQRPHGITNHKELNFAHNQIELGSGFFPCPFRYLDFGHASPDAEDLVTLRWTTDPQKLGDNKCVLFEAAKSLC